MNLAIILCLILLVPLAGGCQQGTSLPANDKAVSKPVAMPPTQLILEMNSSVKMELVMIPAGTFTMGSANDEKDREPDEGPVRKVIITKPFFMGVYEVTQEQYETVMGTNPSRFKGPRRTVEGIWWSDAVEFCRRLSKKTGRIVRLPTEAEWEYACRAGTTGWFSFGNSYGDLSSYARHSDATRSTAVSRGDGFSGTADVGSFKSNRWGLYDIHGNVFEWCNDWYRDSYADTADIDPQGASSGAYRVLRGGSWASPPWQCRSAYRHRFTADGRFNHLIGFRVVAELE